RSDVRGGRDVDGARCMGRGGVPRRLPDVRRIRHWFRALARIPAASAGAYIYASTLVAVVGGVLLLQEPVTLGTVAGGGMIIAGVVLAQHLGKRLRSASDVSGPQGASP